MPAVVNMSVGSPCGTSGEDGTSAWPRSTKKSRNARRSSAPVLSELVGDIRSPGMDGGPAAGGGRAGTGRPAGEGRRKIAESPGPSQAAGAGPRVCDAADLGDRPACDAVDAGAGPACDAVDARAGRRRPTRDPARPGAGAYASAPLSSGSRSSTARRLV